MSMINRSKRNEIYNVNKRHHHHRQRSTAKRIVKIIPILAMVVVIVNSDNNNNNKNVMIKKTTKSITNNQIQQQQQQPPLSQQQQEPLSQVLVTLKDQNKNLIKEVEDLRIKLEDAEESSLGQSLISTKKLKKKIRIGRIIIIAMHM
ncbi:hypothetical protein HUG17_9731 [Dermatophagoides farinae]|uniref:Uncharacterized protein n=1 Tax=Dermatophagoides farinae TaxID=6954 RepID=A0A9D4P4Q0_DERFA|nr:hypothetical protein HUG17_9731 [Dermatophagoides farinae]